MKFLLIILIFLFIPYAFYSYTDEEEDWYKTQEGTGIGNCGPASVAMGITYQTGIDTSVEEIRRYIGKTHPSGSTSFQHLINTLKHYNISYDIVDLSSVNTVDKILSTENSIVIILIFPNRISKSDPSIDEKEGRLYRFDSESAHYIVLKDTTRQHFIVHDPMPNGDNRMYNKEEIFKSLKTRKGIEIFK